MIDIEILKLTLFPFLLPRNPSPLMKPFLGFSLLGIYPLFIVYSHAQSVRPTVELRLEALKAVSDAPPIMAFVERAEKFYDLISRFELLSAKEYLEVDVSRRLTKELIEKELSDKAESGERTPDGYVILRDRGWPPIRDLVRISIRDA